MSVTFLEYDINNAQSYTREELRKLIRQQPELQKATDWTKVQKRILHGQTYLEYAPEPRLNQMRPTPQALQQVCSEMGVKLKVLDKPVSFPNIIEKIELFPNSVEYEVAVEALADLDEFDIVEGQKIGYLELPLPGIVNSKLVTVGKVTFRAGSNLAEMWEQAKEAVINSSMVSWDEGNSISFEFDSGFINYQGETHTERNFYPKYQTMPYDDNLRQNITGILTSGKYPTISDISEEDIADELVRWNNELAECSKKYYRGSGTLKGQIGRYRAVKAAATKRKEPAIEYQEYKEFANAVNPLGGIKINMNSPSIGDWERQFRQETGTPLFKINTTAMCGVQWPPGTKRGTVVEQDYLLAAAMLIAIDNGTYADKWASWAGVAAFKNKDEVYERKDIEEKTRNYTVFASFFMLPALAFSSLLHYKQPKHGDGDCVVMNNFSVFNGEFNKFIENMIESCRTGGLGVAIYADNLYLCTKVNGEFYLVSLDGVKFEGANTRKLVAMENMRMIDHAVETLHCEIPASFKEYFLHILPDSQVDGVAILGKTQFVFEQMASGTVGTFTYNTALMTWFLKCLIDVTSNSTEDLFQFTDGNLVKGKLLEEAETLAGISLTLEGFVNLEKVEMYSEIQLDILGFNGIKIEVGNGVSTWVPKLAQERLIKSETFLKTKVSDGLQKTLVQYCRSLAFYMIGDWTNPVRSYVHMYLITRALKSLEFSGIEPQQSEEVRFFLKDQLEDDGGAGSMMFDLLSKFIDHGTLPVINQPTLFKLLTGIDDDRIENAMQKLGVKTKEGMILNVPRNVAGGIEIDIVRYTPIITVLSKLPDLTNEEITRVKVVPHTSNKIILPIHDKEIKSGGVQFHRLVTAVDRMITNNMKVHYVPSVPPAYRTELSASDGVLWSNLFHDLSITFGVSIEFVKDAALITKLNKIFILHHIPTTKGVNYTNSLHNLSPNVENYLMIKYDHLLFMKPNMFKLQIDNEYYHDHGVNNEEVKQLIANNQPITLKEYNPNQKPAQRKERVYTKPKKSAMILTEPTGSVVVLNEAEVKKATAQKKPNKQKTKVSVPTATTTTTTSSKVGNKKLDKMLTTLQTRLDTMVQRKTISRVIAENLMKNVKRVDDPWIKYVLTVLKKVHETEQQIVLRLMKNISGATYAT